MAGNTLEIRSHGEFFACVAGSLETDGLSNIEPSEPTKRRFEWADRGAGLYIVKTPEHAALWVQYLLEWSDGSNVMYYTAGEIMKEGSQNLPCAIKALSKARNDRSINDVFIVLCNDNTPEKFSTIRNFDTAYRAGNEQAIFAKKLSRQKIQETMSWSTEYINHLNDLVHSYIYRTVKESVDNEAAIVALRTKGGQVSAVLADALEYEYYRIARSFVDAGSAYRKLPTNTKVALIVDQNVLDWMMADVQEDYSTVRELEDLGLGVNDLDGQDPFEGSVLRASFTRNECWINNPAEELEEALLTFANNNLYGER